MKTTHLCVDIRGLLLRNDRELRGVIRDDSGTNLPPVAAREWLLDRLAEGKKVLPTTDECEGFSYQTGCPGHEQLAS